MDATERALEVFMEVQRGLPRQGPGDKESTLKALSLCRGLPDRPAVLDIGCGPGLQTLVLAEALDGHITAVDLHQEYLDLLRESAQTAGQTARIDCLAADMTALPFPPESFDLIWSEGAAYIMGIGAALAAWRPLLRPRGHLAFTELVWLQPDPPAEVSDFFKGEYPAMADVQDILASLEDKGYEPLAHFTLPDSAWWNDYYGPLEAKLPALDKKYGADAEARAIVEATRREIDMRKRFGGYYGYVFFVGQQAAST